jgi:hypothetical protein
LTDEQARDRRLVQNERLIRESNWEEALAADRVDGQEEVEFHCACGRPDCHERLLLTVAEYRAAHAHPHRFIVAPGHADDRFERLVEQCGHYDIVEKRPEYQGFDPTAP